MAVWGRSIQAQASAPEHVIVLHAARLLEVETGKVLKPGEVLVKGERIVEVGTAVKHPAGAEIIDLGDRTLLPGLIDAHIHLFLHPGAEDLQTVQESVPQRTIMATLGARDDLMAAPRAAAANQRKCGQHSGRARRRYRLQPRAARTAERGLRQQCRAVGRGNP